MIVPVILAGGSGTRLWPLSRQLYPKQFIPLVGDNTLFQETALRLGEHPDIAPPIVVCGEAHRFMVAEQAREKGIALMRIVLEPESRNTAPAAYAAARLALEFDDDPVLLVLPADHHIKDRELLLSTAMIGEVAAREGSLVTFGVVPHYAETGFGYIERGEDLAHLQDAYRIARFIEKPDAEKAARLVDSGKFYWNSGMFMFSARKFMAELEKFQPEMAQACGWAVEKGRSDADFFRLDAESFRPCPSDSIDFAVMEYTTDGAVIPLYAGWNDIGSWSALWDVKDKDENRNVTVGDVVMHDVHGSYMHSTSRLLAVVGLDEHVIVETADAVMVSPKNRVQDVKMLVEKLKSDKRQEVSLHKKVYRPWGAYETVDIQERFQVKRITVRPGAVLSLQKHHHRSEHWVVVRGTALVTCGEEIRLMKEDESVYIPLGTIHRLENPGKIDLELIEVQTGSFLGEDDIVRFEDKYGRQI